MIYNIVLVSHRKQNESVIHILIHMSTFFFFRFFPYIGHHRVLSRIPCIVIQQVLVNYLFTVYCFEIHVFLSSWKHLHSIRCVSPTQHIRYVQRIPKFDCDTLHLDSPLLMNVVSEKEDPPEKVSWQVKVLQRSASSLHSDKLQHAEMQESTHSV